MNNRKIVDEEKEIAKAKKNNGMYEAKENQVSVKKERAFDIPIHHAGKISKKQIYRKNGL
jgi:hypothetical protein